MQLITITSGSSGNELPNLLQLDFQLPTFVWFAIFSTLSRPAECSTRVTDRLT